jgi:putative transposase
VRKHKGWYSRDHLPHFDAPELVQAITFRLADSLPREVFERLRDETDPNVRSKVVEKALDLGHGSCCLRDPRIGRIVEDSLSWGDGERYLLLAWVVMPNHVHVLIEVIPGHPTHGIVNKWKSFTARRINALFGRSGALWQADFFDRFVRDDSHYAAVVRYIEENPVKARLVSQAKDWPFSSARLRRRHVAEER